MLLLLLLLLAVVSLVVAITPPPYPSTSDTSPRRMPRPGDSEGNLCHHCMRAVPRGLGATDWVDALTVALDSLNRTIEERPVLKVPKVMKKILLVSNFLAPVGRVGWGSLVVRVMPIHTWPRSLSACHGQ